MISKIYSNNNYGDYMQYLFSTLRGASIFIIMLFTIRILGKKELGQLSIFDLVVLLIISDLCSMGIPDKKLYLIGLLCLAILVLLQKLISVIMKKNKKIREVLDGKPTIFIMNGVIYYENLKKEGYTIDDIICQARENAIMDLSEIRLAILETTGKLSVFSMKRYDRVTLPIIESGMISKDNMEILGLNEEDIKLYVFNEGYNLSEILYASSDGIRINIIKVSNFKIDK